QAWIRKFRSVHGGQGRIERAGADHILRRIRWTGGAGTGWNPDGGGVETCRRGGCAGTVIPGAVESRSRDGGAQSRRTASAFKEVRILMEYKQFTLALAATCLIVGAPAFSQTAAPSRSKAHIETLASDKFDGRLTGTPGERLARACPVR